MRLGRVLAAESLDNNVCFANATILRKELGQAIRRLWAVGFKLSGQTVGLFGLIDVAVGRQQIGLAARHFRKRLARRRALGSVRVSQQSAAVSLQ